MCLPGMASFWEHGRSRPHRLPNTPHNRRDCHGLSSLLYVLSSDALLNRDLCTTSKGFTGVLAIDKRNDLNRERKKQKVASDARGWFVCPGRLLRDRDIRSILLQKIQRNIDKLAAVCVEQNRIAFSYGVNHVELLAKIRCYGPACICTALWRGNSPIRG